MQLIGRQETIIQLFPGEALGKLTSGITDAVDRSFQDDKGKLRGDITHWEIRDRFRACMSKAKMMRGDLKWGLDRIVGQMDEVLRCHLAKTDYTVPSRALWMPDDSR